MFNSPILDVTIGLVLIFLMYSLLATSVNESIATLFGLRARMLRNAIIERMLSNTPKDNRWMSIWKGVREFFIEFFKIFTGKREKEENEKKIGDHFFDHPLIKNYGSSRVFPLPSYIPKHNFSTILIDVLKQEFNKRMDEIAEYKSRLPSNVDSLDNIRTNLRYSTDVIKVKEVIEYYGRYYSSPAAPSLQGSVIDKETWWLLQLHLKESYYNIENFIEKLEGWFEDFMNRVTGWYKRQTQALLFIIGVSVAVLFNVDPIEISHRLSFDKDARDKLVQIAIRAPETNENDQRITKPGNTGAIIQDSSAITTNSKVAPSHINLDSIVQQLATDRENAKNLIALGWGNYGKVSGKATFWEKVGYVCHESIKLKKLGGILITAFAISLGAPFWFDLLNKFIKLRGAGKKEDEEEMKRKIAQVPVNVFVNSQPGDDAVG